MSRELTESVFQHRPDLDNDTTTNSHVAMCGKRKVVLYYCVKTKSFWICCMTPANQTKIAGGQTLIEAMEIARRWMYQEDLSE